MELLLVHLTDIHIRDEADFEILSERIDSVGGAICTHITEPEETKVFAVEADVPVKEAPQVKQEVKQDQIVC